MALICSITVGTFLIFGLIPGVSMFEGYQSLIPNGDRIPDPCVENQIWDGVGHTRMQGGGSRNPFGIDFFNASMEWMEKLCRTDSDGDGWTNGEELGDPDCMWSPGNTNPPLQQGIGNHPGVCEPYDSPDCQQLNAAAGIKLCQKKKEFGCPATEQSGVQSIRLRLPDGTRVPTTPTTYMCKAFDLPSDKDYHAIAVKPIIGTSKVLHHIIVYGCPESSTEYVSGFNEPKLCGSMVSTNCPFFMNIWPLGSPGSCMINEAGLRFGSTTFNKVIIEYHWTNGLEEEGLTDTSGVQIFFQDATLRENDASTTLGGPSYLSIPPGEKSVLWTGSLPAGECSQQFYPEKTYILDMYLHMHLLGKSAKAEQFRDGKKIRTIAEVSDYTYDDPEIVEFRPPIEFLPGDEMRVTCEFDSTSRTDYTYYGDATTDEMCFAIYTYYPRQEKTLWITMGNIDQCSIDAAYLPSSDPAACSVPDFYLTDLETILDGTVSAECDLTGKTCPSSCQSYLKSVSDSVPCLQGDWKYLAQSVIMQVEAQVQGISITELKEGVVLAMRACDRLVFDINKWDPVTGTDNTVQNTVENTVPQGGTESESDGGKTIMDTRTAAVLATLAGWIAVKGLISVLNLVE